MQLRQRPPALHCIKNHVLPRRRQILAELPTSCVDHLWEFISLPYNYLLTEFITKPLPHLLQSTTARTMAWPCASPARNESASTPIGSPVASLPPHGAIRGDIAGATLGAIAGANITLALAGLRIIHITTAIAWILRLRHIHIGTIITIARSLVRQSAPRGCLRVHKLRLLHIIPVHSSGHPGPGPSPSPDDRLIVVVPPVKHLANLTPNSSTPSFKSFTDLFTSTSSITTKSRRSSSRLFCSAKLSNHRSAKFNLISAIAGVWMYFI